MRGNGPDNYEQQKRRCIGYSFIKYNPQKEEKTNNLKRSMWDCSSEARKQFQGLWWISIILPSDPACKKDEMSISL